MILTGKERVLVSGVSPTGGLASVAESVSTQDIANLGVGGNGGFASLVALGVAANGRFDGASLPANSYLGPMLLFRETAGLAVSVSIGTTLAGSDVLAAQAVPSGGTLTVDITAFAKVWFSATVPQALFLTSASWGGAVINAQLFYVVGMA